MPPHDVALNGCEIVNLFWKWLQNNINWNYDQNGYNMVFKKWKNNLIPALGWTWKTDKIIFENFDKTFFWNFSENIWVKKISDIFLPPHHVALNGCKIDNLMPKLLKNTLKSHYGNARIQNYFWKIEKQFDSCYGMAMENRQMFFWNFLEYF